MCVDSGMEIYSYAYTNKYVYVYEEPAITFEMPFVMIDVDALFWMCA